VTSFEFNLHPLGPEVMLAAVAYHLDDARELLPKWRELLQTMPEEVTPLVVFWSVPEGFPPELVGTPIVIIAAVYAGPADEGERITQPFRELATPVLDLSARQPWTAVQSGFDQFFPKGRLYYWKSTYVEAISDELIDALCTLAADRPSSLTTMDIWPLDGAPMRVGAGETAFGRRPPFLLAFEASWTDPADNDANIAWARDAYTSMSRFQSSGIYLNFPGFGEEKDALVRSAYGLNYDRLVQIKTKYDPDNLFRMNVNIAPGTGRD
jgi:FAD/FMN-containing dehydrogenase